MVCVCCVLACVGVIFLPCVRVFSVSITISLRVICVCIHMQTECDPLLYLPESLQSDSQKGIQGSFEECTGAMPRTSAFLAVSLMGGFVSCLSTATAVF
jgi:hypothetical protein